VTRWQNRIVIISVNDTVHPSTGGEYTYYVMKNELEKQNYRIHEISIPLLSKTKKQLRSNNPKRRIYVEFLANMRCVLESFVRRVGNQSLIITSSSPAFPVFGHLVYHQPKAGICFETYKPYLSLYEKVGFMIHEDEKLSPVWGLAKRSHTVNLSNSLFTEKLVKKLYGLDSCLLYPPVKFPDNMKMNLHHARRHGMVVVRPKIINGITLLPEIAKDLPKGTNIVAIGQSDQIGLKIMNALKKNGYNINYLGFVDESTKWKLFQTFSHYLHLGFNESFGITVVEAMNAGCIPIAPKSGALPEYLSTQSLYSNPSEVAMKFTSRADEDEHVLRQRLKTASEKFAEIEFRKNFMAYVRSL
jgi:glycosyltransferase involved in cell wall biosynthesis